jgi:hypothetical protein
MVTLFSTFRVWTHCPFNQTGQILQQCLWKMSLLHITNYKDTTCKNDCKPKCDFRWIRKKTCRSCPHEESRAKRECDQKIQQKRKNSLGSVILTVPLQMTRSKNQYSTSISLSSAIIDTQGILWLLSQYFCFYSWKIRIFVN